MFTLGHNKLNFQTVQSNAISNVNKAAGIDVVSGTCLEDGAVC